MAIVLFVAWGASTFHRRFYVGGGKNCVPFFLPIVFTATMLAWWFWDTTTMGTLSGLLAESFNFHYFQVTGAPAGLMDYVLAPVEVAYNNLGLFLPLFFSLIGIFSMIMEKRHVPPVCCCLHRPGSVWDNYLSIRYRDCHHS